MKDVFESKFFSGAWMRPEIQLNDSKCVAVRYPYLAYSIIRVSRIIVIFMRPG